MDIKCTPYLEYQIKVNWYKNVNKFWKIEKGADLHKYFNIVLEEYTTNDKVDVSNDIIVFRPHLEINTKIYDLLDKGIRFIVDCLWENHSFVFQQLAPYAKNGIALISGNYYPIENWPDDNLNFVPMSFWYIEYFRRKILDLPEICLNRDKVTHDFLMPIMLQKPLREKFLELLGDNITKSIYSAGWKGVYLPFDYNLSDKTQSWERGRFFNPEWYKSTYFSMVIETLQENEVFITEKTFKPIMYGHPFMIYGPKGILQILRDYGFNTFPELFDEKYDDEPDPIQRAKLIIEQIENFDDKKMHSEKFIIDDKIFQNHQRFFNKEIMLSFLDNDVRKPIENFLNDR